MTDRAPVVVDVIAPGERGRKLEGIRAYAGPPPLCAERDSVAGIPCTSLARTLADIAGTSGERTVRNAFETAAFKQMLDLDAIDRVLAGRRRVGATFLRGLVAEWRSAAGHHPTRPKLRSPFEAKLLPMIATADLPPPLVNAPVLTPGGRLEVDLLWPEHRFVVEADSRRHHGTDLAYEHDRWRDRELLRAGYATLRVPWRHAEQEPDAVLDAIRTELGARLP